MAKKDFIENVGKIAQDVYRERGTVLPSVCVAQAGLESGWRLNCQTLFGIKGKGNRLLTQEFINGKFVTVSAEFKKYDNISEAVIQYYDLMNTSRYKNVKNLKTAEEQIRFIHRQGYATDPDYSDKILKIICCNNLTEFDNISTVTNSEDEKLYEVAQRVIRGEYGNGAMRRAKLRQDGYDYKVIQNIVNQLI